MTGAPLRRLSLRSLSPGDAAKLDQCPSSGPHANLTGMRRIWGPDCKPVQVGVYFYNVARFPGLYDLAT